MRPTPSASDLCRNWFPRPSRFAVLINPTNVNSARSTIKELDEAAAALGLKVRHNIECQQFA